MILLKMVYAFDINPPMKFEDDEFAHPFESGHGSIGLITKNKCSTRRDADRQTDRQTESEEKNEEKKPLNIYGDVFLYYISVS